jgi:hypothetical protein
MPKKKTPRTPAPAPRRRAKQAAPRQKGLIGVLRDFGVLRVGLILLTLAVMVSAPKPGTQAVYSGWELWPTLMAPVLAPILVQVVLLDALMGRVMMGSAKGAERARYRRIMFTNLGLAVALTAWYAPYFAALMR